MCLSICVVCVAATTTATTSATSTTATLTATSAATLPATTSTPPPQSSKYSCGKWPTTNDSKDVLLMIIAAVALKMATQNL